MKMSPPPALIVLAHVTKRYPTPSGFCEALRDVSLSVAAGEFVAVVGKSGSGKSTLIHVLTGIDTPSAGTVRVAGRAIDQLGEDQLALWRGKNVGVIFQF